MSTSAQIRSQLIQALSLDLVGPTPDILAQLELEGRTEEAAELREELLDRPPNRWYQSGFLIQTRSVAHGLEGHSRTGSARPVVGSPRALSTAPGSSPRRKWDGNGVERSGADGHPADGSALHRDDDSSHEGAIAMADLALTRAKRPEIKELAKSIMASQTQENARCRPDTGSGSAVMFPTGRPEEPWAWAAWTRVVAWVWTRAWA